MAKYRLTGPDGSTYEVTAPDTASQDDVLKTFHANMGTGAQTHNQIAAQVANDPISQGAKNFADDIPWYQKAAAAVGKSVQDYIIDPSAGAVRGAGSIGATALAPVDMIKDALDGKGLSLASNRQRRQDMTDATASLGANPNSVPYQVGKLGGEIAGTAGAGQVLANGARALGAAEPVVNALASGGFRTGAQAGGNVLARAGDLALRAGAGATVGGVSAGMVDPQQAANGALIGGALPPVTQALGGAGRAVGGFLQGAVEPWYEGGRQAIAGRTMQRFGIQPGDVQGLSNAPTVTGARPTLAEQITRPEGAAAAAQLQDAVRTLDPQIAARMATREAENNAARVDTLRELAGQGGARDFAVANRSGTAAPMYEEAFNVAADGRNLAPEQARQMQTLMRSPAIRDAAAAARENAMNAGSNVGPSNASGSVEGLHQIKLALDDAITRAESKTTPAGANAVSGLRDAQKRLVSFIESISPEYANARGVYAQMSRPINQMDVAGEVLKRGTSNTSDLAGYPRLMPNALTGAMRDEPALIRNATGRNLGGGSLDSLMEPQQLNALRGVTGEVDRAAAVARAGAGPGSPTAQRLASTNILQQMGVPEVARGNALVQTILRPVQFAANLAEPRIQQTLLDVIQNPQLAQQAMQRATPAQRVQLQALISRAAQLGYRAAPVAGSAQ